MILSKKQVIELSKTLDAEDITNYNSEEVNRLYNMEKGFTTVAYSVGTYGVNSYLCKGNTSDNVFIVKARNTNLFIIM